MATVQAAVLGCQAYVQYFDMIRAFAYFGALEHRATTW